MKKHKQYSVKQAADATGFCRAAVSRFCQRGQIGERRENSPLHGHVYLLSPADIAWLRERRAQSEKK